MCTMDKKLWCGPHHQPNSRWLVMGLPRPCLPPGGEQAAGESKETWWEKRLTPFTRHQRIQWRQCFITSSAHRTTCVTFVFFAMPEGQQSQDFFVQGNSRTQIPSPGSFQLTVQQPTALPVTPRAHRSHWGCCHGFQQGIEFHPLLTIFLLVNATAFWERPIFQNGVVLLKKNRSCQEKSKTVNELLSRAGYISNRFNKKHKDGKNIEE